MKPYKVVPGEPGHAYVTDRATEEHVGYVFAVQSGWQAWYGNPFAAQELLGRYQYRDDAASWVWEAHLDANP